MNLKDKKLILLKKWIILNQYSLSTVFNTVGLKYYVNFCDLKFHKGICNIELIIQINPLILGEEFDV